MAMDMLLKLLMLLGIDLILVALLGFAVVVPLMTLRRPAYAVLKRNFIGYFGNPTGYLFLCAFVLVTSLAAFIPPEFFASNLANLDQLNKWLPLIMLFYISTITMSIWSEERRQGTDELLLTLPADDFDIVVGKYLAAASIFTTALLFSQISNLAVLISLTLGDVDVGLLFTTYLGYWLMGLAMLSIGMVASFLTRNLTIGFMLGVLFNAPMVLLGYADWIVADDRWVQLIRRMSVSAFLEDFGRGVVSLPGMIYFAMLIVVGIYFSMVLIGRRHWLGGRDGASLLLHYVVRAAAIVVIAFSLTLVAAAMPVPHLDTTRGQVSSLSPDTKKIVRELNVKQPVKIEAFISVNVPQDMLKTRRDLISMLKEFERLGGSKVQVIIHDNLEPSSEEAQKADERFGIKPQRISTQTRGTFKDEAVILGAAFMCGLEKVVIPFFESGMPIEYELIRSIATVARGERYRIGVVKTAANMMGDISMAGMQPRSTPRRAIIAELEQQYNVEEVVLTQAVDTDRYHALLVVQPSSLPPDQLPHLINAVKAGVPTAIFEDPLSVFLGVVGTGEPNQPNMNMMMMMGGMQQGAPKCDITLLWDELGLEMIGSPGQAAGPGAAPLYQPDLVWQDYNPYPQLGFSDIGPEFVFIRDNMPGARQPINETDEITSGIEELLFPFSGAIKAVAGSNATKLERLVVTDGEHSGSFPASKWRERADSYQFSKERGKPTGEKILAARIRLKKSGKSDAADSKDKADVQKMADEGSPEKQKDADKETAEKKKDRAKRELHVVYVADTDVLSDQLVGLRNRPDATLNFRFENVTFVLNTLDSLVGDERFLEIRKRKLRYNTLKLMEEEVKSIREEQSERLKSFGEDIEKLKKDAEAESEAQYKFMLEKKNELEKKQEQGVEITLDELKQITTRLSEMETDSKARLQRRVNNLNAQFKTETDRTNRKIDNSVRRIQNLIKILVVCLPALPPLIVGLVVFARRRIREREGISRARLR